MKGKIPTFPDNWWEQQQKRKDESSAKLIKLLRRHCLTPGDIPVNKIIAFENFAFISPQI